MADIILISDILLVSMALLWLVTATIQDVKRREVYNWLSFSLIIFALGIRALASIISKQPAYFTFSLLGLGIAFLVANLFYYARIFAGGDAKLLMALGTAFSTTPVFINNQFYISVLNLNVPFLLNFIVNMFFIGSVYGIIYSMALALINRKKFLKEFKTMLKIHKIITYSFLIVAFILIWIALLQDNRLLLLALASLLFPYFLIFVRAVERTALVKTVSVDELAEGDWLFKAVRAGKKVIKPNWQGLSREEINKIRKSRIKKVAIKQGIPFVPVFLLSFITSLFTNILLLLLQIIG